MISKKNEIKEGIEEKIKMPEGVDVSINNGVVNIKGKKGELSRNFFNPMMNISLDDKKIILKTKRATKREKKIVGTIKAHIKNMFKGIGEGHVYKLRICSGHFPMNVSISKDEFIIKNFLGEKIPRVLKIKQGATVKIQGQDVIVESTNKEIAGQVAADIESLTKIKNKDLRVFQDGIYIINKDGKIIK